MTTYACPRCGAPSTKDNCAVCGRGYEPLLAELGDVDGQLAAQRRSVDAARERLLAAEGVYSALSARRRQVIARLAERERQLRSTTPPRPVPPPPAPMPSARPVPMSPAPVAARPAPAPVPAGPGRTEASGKAVQNLLLILGGILAAIAAISFTTVAWVNFGVGGRAAILTVVTLLTLAAPVPLRRKGLTSTAETLSAVGMLLIVLDGVALWLLGLAGDSGFEVFLGGACLVAGAVGIGYHRFTGLRVPLYAVPALSLVTVVTAVSQPPVPVALTLLALVVVLNAATAAIARETAAANAAGGFAVAALLVAAGDTTVHFAPSRLGLVVAVAVAVLTVLVRRLPQRVRVGPVFVTIAGHTLAVLAIGYQVLDAVISALEASTPVWTASARAPEAPGSAWQLPVAIAVLVLAELLAPRHPWRHETVLAGLALAVLAAPGTFGIGWRVSVPGLLVLAAVGAIGVTATAGRGAGRPYRAGERAAAVAAVLVFATSLSFADRAYTAVALSTVVVVGLVTAVLGHRLSPSTAPARAIGAAGLAIACWAAPATIAVTLRLTALPTAITVLTTIATAAAIGTAAAVASTVSTRRRPEVLLGAGLGVGTAAVTGTGVSPVWVPALAALAVVVALVLLAAAFELAVAEGRPVRAAHAAAGGSTFLLLSALALLGHRLFPPVWLLGAVGLAVLAGAAVRLLPPTARTGAGMGVVVLASIIGGATAVLAAVQALAGLAATRPVWAADTGAWASTVDDVRVLGWQPPVALAACGVAALLLLRAEARHHASLACGVLALLSAPVSWALPWPTATAMTMAAAAGLAVAACAGRYAYVRLTTAIGLALYSLGTSLATVASTVAALGAIVVLCAVVAAVSARTDRVVVGGVAVVGGVLALPGLAASAVVLVSDGGPVRSTAQIAPAPVLIAAMGAACLGLLAAALLRARGSRYLPYATVAVPVVAAFTAFLSAPFAVPTRVYAAVAALVAVGAALLHLPDRAGARVRALFAVPTLVLAALAASPVLLAPLTFPYTWLADVWSRTPRSTVDGLAPVTVTPPGGVLDVAVLAAVALTGCLATLGLAGRRWVAPVAVGGLGAVVIAAPVALDWPWPSAPAVSLAVAVAAALVAGFGGGGRQSAVMTAVAVVVGAPGLAGALAAEGTTLGALGVCAVVTTAVALRGTGTARRAAGWAVTGVLLPALVIAAGQAAGLPARFTALGVLGVAVVLLVVARAVLAAGSDALDREHRSETRAVLSIKSGALVHVPGPSNPPAAAASHLAGPVPQTPSRRTTVPVTVELLAHLNAAVALVIAVVAGGSATGGPDVRPAATVLAIYGAVLGLVGMRAGAAAVRRTYAWTAAGLELVAYWLLIASAEVDTIEAYTLPVAGIALAAGWLEFRKRPELRSWVAFGPGLLAAFAPTLAPVLVTAGDPLRRLLLGVTALAVLLLGALWRLRAPVLIGGGVLLAVALHELVLLWTLVPAWLPIAVAALLLLITGATFEQRRRDFRRVSGSLRAMR